MGQSGVGESWEVIVGFSRGIPHQSKEEIKQKISSPEIICVSPVPGRVYTRTADLSCLDTTHEEVGTSECNVALMEEPKNFFDNNIDQEWNMRKSNPENDQDRKANPNFEAQIETDR